MRYRPGDPVTILPPYEQPILEQQHYATVVDELPSGYIVSLECTFPPNKHFGPFPADRLATGWKDGNGRWRVP